MNTFGTPMELVRAFGGRLGFEQAVYELQKQFLKGWVDNGKGGRQEDLVLL